MKAMKNTTNQTPTKRSKVKGIVIAAVLLLLLAIVATGIFLFSKGGERGGDWLMSQLENSRVNTITLEGDCYLEGPVQICGEKIIEGEGTIFFAGEAEESLKWKDYQIPEDECFLLGIPELEKRTAMFTMEKGSSLTIGGKVTVNAQGKALAVNVPAGATLTIRDDALITGGLAANIVNQGTVSVEGGTVLADTYFGIMNYAKLSVTGGALESKAKNLACVVSSGEAVVSGGAMKATNSTNIYVTDGKLSVTGGALETAAFDNIYVAKGTAEITGGTITGGHGVHNAGGSVNVTGGQWLSSSHALYNEGEMTVTGVTIEKTLNHAIVNRGENAKLIAKDVTIGTATVHGVYNIRGAHMEVENLNIDNAMGKGVHNGGAFFTGKNITINRTMGAGVGNEREKGWQQDGTLTIQGLTVKKAGSKNIVCTAGEVNVSDATLGSIQSNSVQVSGGVVNLKDVEISGTVGSGALHGIYLTGGVVNAENVTIGSTIGRGIQNRGAQFNGKNITIKDSRSTGIGNQLSTDGTTNGTITIDGLEMSGGRGYYIHNVDGGTIDIKNGNVTIANNTGLRVDNGTVNLTNFTMTGLESEVTYNGFTVNGGALNLKNVTLKDMTGRGINNMGGTVAGSEVTILNNKATAIYSEGGKTQLTQVSTSGTKGYNVDAKGGTLELTDATLGKSGSTSINVDTGSNVILNRVVVNGTQKGHAVYVHKKSQLTFKNLSIFNAGARALSNGNASNKVEGGTVVGTGLTISKSAATAIGNDSGTMKLENVKVTDCTANTVNVKSGAVTINAGTLGKTSVTNVVLGGGELNLKGVSIQGTTKDNGITTTAGKLTVDNVTVTGAAGRGINNIGATITGTDLTVTKAGASAIYNEGTIDLKKVTLSENTGYNVDARKGTVKITDGKLAITPVSNVNVSAGATAELVDTQVLGSTTSHAVTALEDAILVLNNVSITGVTADKKHGINMTGGTVTLDNVTVTNITGAEARGIYQAAGTLTLTGTTTLGSCKLIGFQPAGGITYINGAVTVTDTPNSINVGGSGQVHIGENGKLTSDVGVYLPKNGYLTVDAATIGNTAQEPLKIRPDNITSGTVLVKASSAEAANNVLSCVKLLSENLFTEVSGTDIVAINQQQEEEEVQKVTVSDWAALLAAVDGAEAGKQLTIVLTQSIEQPADGGSATVKGGKIVTVTDEGKGYTITRSASGALFQTGYDGTLTFDGALTIANTNTSGTALANNGNMTLNNTTVDFSAAYNILSMNSDNAAQTGGHDLILKNVTMTNVTLTIKGGTVEAEDLTISGISTGSVHGINMIGGTATLKGDVSITDITGSNARGIYQAGGTLTIAEDAVLTLSNNKLVGGHFSSGTTYINGTIIDTNTANAVNCGATNVHLGAKGKIVSDIGVYLPKNGYLTMDAATIGNTAQEPLKIRPSNMNIGSVLVKASSAEAAQNVLSSVKLLSEDLFTKVSGTDIVVTNQQQEEEEEQEKQEVAVGDWASLKTAIEGAEDGATLVCTLSQSITQPADGGSITVNNGKNVTITDGDKGYTITRDATGAALFATESGGTLTVNGKVAINGGTGSVMELVSAGNLNLTGVTLENVSLKITGGSANVTNTTVTGIATDKKHGINMTGGTVTLHNVTVTNISGAEARGIYQSAGTLTLTGTTTLSSCKLIGFQPAGGTTYIRGTIHDTNTANSINVGGGATVYLNADAKIISNIGIYLPSSGKLQLEQGVTSIGNTAAEPLKIRHNNMTASGFIVLKTGSAEAAGNIAPCVVILNGTTTNLHASYQVAVSGNNVITNKVS